MKACRTLGAAIVTAIILGLYGLVVTGLVPPLAPDGHETLKNLAIMVASYWVGSSSGSAAKDRAQP